MALFGQIGPNSILDIFFVAPKNKKMMIFLWYFHHFHQKHIQKSSNLQENHKNFHYFQKCIILINLQILKNQQVFSLKMQHPNDMYFNYVQKTPRKYIIFTYFNWRDGAFFSYVLVNIKNFKEKTFNFPENSWHFGHFLPKNASRATEY